MNLPLISALFLAFSLTMYVLLDGFDLGVGILLLVQRKQALRDHMADSITPTWDGNETWLIMTGVTLLAGFPIAYGILMPAFYLPLIAMLLALGLRGVSFEFRVQQKEHRERWDIVFGIGSLIAAFAQGDILGGLIQGVPIAGDAFAGTIFHLFKSLPVLSGLTVITAYLVLGSSWLFLKSQSSLRGFARRILLSAVPAFAALFSLVCVLAANIQPGIHDAWQAHPVVLGLLCAVMALAGVAVVAGAATEHRRAVPLLSTFLLVVTGMGGFTWIVFPDIIPFRMSLWQAASSHLSHVFLLIGVLFVAPVVLAYSAYAYWVFRGPTPAKGWEV